MEFFGNPQAWIAANAALIELASKVALIGFGIYQAVAGTASFLLQHRSAGEQSIARSYDVLNKEDERKQRTIDRQRETIGRLRADLAACHAARGQSPDEGEDEE